MKNQKFGWLNFLHKFWCYEKNVFTKVVDIFITLPHNFLVLPEIRKNRFASLKSHPLPLRPDGIWPENLFFLCLYKLSVCSL